MAGFSSLEIGKRALLAQKFGLDVTSNNIANVNTPGFSRRSTVLSETEPIKKNLNFIGSGVIVSKIQSFRQEYYDKEIRNSLSRINLFENDINFLNRIETILIEPGENSISNTLSQFFNSFRELTVRPDNISLRQNLLTISNTLSDRFNQVANNFDELRNDANKNLENIIKNINSLLINISELNNEISKTSSNITTESQTLIDQRATKLEELSKYLDIKIGYNPDGTINIFNNGINILTNNVPSKIILKENVDSFNSERTLKVFKVNEENNSEIEINPSSGELASNLKLYNITLDDNDTSNQYSIARKFNDFVSNFANRINSYFSLGYGLNDNSENPPNRLLFVSDSSEINAKNIKINSQLTEKPEDIPLSSMVKESGNNQIALLVSEFAYDDNFLDNLNPIDFYANFIGKIGITLKENQNNHNSSKLIEQQLNSQRESLMGVNLDEEAVNLIKYQKAFEASTRIITVTNELLANLVRLGL